MAHRIATVLLCVVLGVAFSLHHSINKLSDLITYRLEKRPVQTITETVTRSNGTQVVVVTTRLDGESEAEFVARHDATVAELKK